MSFKCEEVDSNENEFGTFYQHEEDGYESENKLCYNEYEVEVVYNCSGGSSCHDVNECCNNSDIPDCYSNDFSIVISSCHLDDNHS